MHRPTMLLALAALLVLPATAHADGPDAATPPSDRPVVIAHRGASGYRPEHTLAAYRLAIAQGADYIEPDLVSTADGVLVARHENEIGGTTDVASRPEFADRRTTKVIDGARVTGWFTEDFTLAELKTLRAVERIGDLRPANTAYDGQEAIPTLQEVIDLAKRAGRGRRIGVYPETKHPTYFRAIGLPLEEPLVEVLHRNGYRSATSPVVIQSFEVGNLRRLRSMTRLPLAQLVSNGGRPYDFTVAGDPRTYADMVTPAGLAEIATYADGLGAHKNLVLPRDRQQRLMPATTLVRDAHDAGLDVHVWTVRDENTFLPADLRVGDPSDPAFARTRGDVETELRLLLEAGVDGIFADHPDSAVAVRDALFPTPGRSRG